MSARDEAGRFRRRSVRIACSKCGEPCGEFALIYRKKELRADRDDPGHLCGSCAGARDGAMIKADVFGKS